MTGRFESPWERWSRDKRVLSHVTADELERAFVLYLDRTVSPDRLVSIDGVDYELPRSRGFRTGTKVQVTQRLLDGTYHVLHEDKLVEIRPVDLAANARARRARDSSPEEPEPTRSKTAADMAYERDLGPVIDEDGNARDPTVEEETEA